MGRISDLDRVTSFGPGPSSGGLIGLQYLSTEPVASKKAQIPRPEAGLQYLTLAEMVQPVQGPHGVPEDFHLFL